MPARSMICHEQKCIFVHVPKSAGQSIERVFLDLAGLTWETRAPLLLSYNPRPELGPPRLAHLRAGEYVGCKYLSRELFDRYFKFAVVRDPWDRLVSIYKYLGHANRYEFKRYLLTVFKQEVWRRSYWFVRPQAEFLYDDDGKLLVDYVGRFENLQGDFDRVCEKLGLPRTILPHVNRSNVKPAEPTFSREAIRKRIEFVMYGRRVPHFAQYRDYYDDECVQFVADLYRRDIELFGYEFARPAARAV